jgi:DNA/RNA-binding domain of Phe-tRNA-synthetase-like protein
LASDSQILHVYPYRDSVETKIDPSTRDVLVVVAGVPGVEEERLVKTAYYLRKLLSLLGGAAPGEVRLV